MYVHYLSEMTKFTNIDFYTRFECVCDNIIMRKLHVSTQTQMMQQLPNVNRI